ncbi:hypothetical protein EMCRGX_G018213 [Ephydatia muelleri]
MQYRRTPLAEGYSPSELLNGRQIRTKIDALLPSSAHMAQGRQARAATKSQEKEVPERIGPVYSVGTPCYALYCGPRQEKDPRWVPALVTKVFGSSSCNVKVVPKGGTWRRHIEQLRPRYGVLEDADPGEVAINLSKTSCSHTSTVSLQPATPGPPPISPVEGVPLVSDQTRRKWPNPRLPTGSMMVKENNTLKKLNLHLCKLQPEGSEEVIKGVQVNTKLEILVLSYNTIDNKRASCLGTMLKENNTLKELNLRFCGLQPEGLDQVIKGVQIITKLETLVLSYNTIENKRASCLNKNDISYYNEV